MIVTTNDLIAMRERYPHKKIVLAGGVFDLMHPGHLDLFKHMKQAGDIVVVAVSTDKRVAERKGPTRPIHNEQTRLTLVDSARYVDYTLLAPDPDPHKEVPTLQIMQKLRPDIFMTCESSWLTFEDAVTACGAKLTIIPRFNETISTTLTIEKIIRTHTAD
jgi:cytidyltransferase-like protein